MCWFSWCIISNSYNWKMVVGFLLFVFWFGFFFCIVGDSIKKEIHSHYSNTSNL